MVNTFSKSSQQISQAITGELLLLESQVMVLKETLETVKWKNIHLEKEMQQVSSNYEKLAQ